MSKMKMLVNYMKERAVFEGVKWSLSEGYLQAHYDHGVRTFFGVEIDEGGALLCDDQQPDFFEKFRCASRS